MKKILTLLIILASLGTVKSQCLKMDIVLLVDMSGSLQGHEEDIYEAVEAFIDQFKLSENGIQIGLVMFNTDATVLSEITYDREDLQGSLEFLRIYESKNNTNLTEALGVSILEFEKSDRLVDRRLVIISDGLPDSPMEAMKMKNMAELQYRISICTVFIHSDIGVYEGYIFALATNGCYVSTDYQLLVDEIKKLEICM